MKIAVFDSAWEYTLDTPYNKALGGTQSAICYFLEEMKIRNHDVYLFNKVSSELTCRGVKHIPAHTYLNYIKQNNILFDLIIVSCLVNDLFEIKTKLGSFNTLYCLWTGHDIDQIPSKLLKDVKAREMVDLFIFVSDWQRMRYVHTYNIDYNKTLILRNGIGKSFEKYLDMPTNKIKNSMTYCSIPWRGLDLLAPIFKEIKTKHNDASLKIFSGMNIYMAQEQNNKSYDEFKTMESVEHNYGISQSQLADELYKIDMLTYPNTFQETSCITALQAMACGCIIITSKLGALEETMNGLNKYVNINIYNFNREQYINNFVQRLNETITMPQESKEKLREKNREHIRKNYTWNVICERFENDILVHLNNYKQFIENHDTIYKNYLSLFSSGKWAESIEYSQVIKNYTNLNEYYTIKLNNGVSYFNINFLDKAKEYFKVAKELNNDFITNKNIALLELKRNDINKFIKYCRRAVNINFDQELGLLLAEKYDQLGYYEEAIGLYKNLIKLNPNNVNALNNLGNIKLVCISNTEDPDITIQSTYFKSLDLCCKLNEHRKKELVLSNIIFNNLYNWKLSDEEIFKRSCDWSKYFPKEEKYQNIVDKLDRTKTSENKIRVGYISCDFITHPVGYMFESILKNHDTNLFEIFCYDCSDPEKSTEDFVAKKLRAYNNAKWVNVYNKNDNDLLELIVNDNLDILVDMMGHTRNTRMNILQYKPARIMISYFAYPSTNGLDSMDYKFTDKYANPPETQQYFKEKLYYLPNGFQCYTPPIELESIKNYNRNKYKIHLCCFNNPTKLSQSTLNTFSEILKRLPQSKLFLRYCYYKSSYIREIIIKQFEKRGIDRERIDIGYDHLLDALKLYNNMDIALDPYPYNGGTISSEALYMNTPFITLAGTNYVSRVGVSLLSNLGLEKYIANSEEEYIQKVVDLANNESELKLLHQTIRLKMMNSDLADSVGFTKNIEDSYRDMCNCFNKK
jgi:predicted O-linked N-acetylglucosamine transferase (SPINDLY family)/glycosyltransferase involved in cell wall biosynthesis